MASGIIISDSEPAKDNNYAWLKVNSDGSCEWYALQASEWVLQKTVKTVGLTGSRTVGGYILTFTDGLLTGFRQA